MANKYERYEDRVVGKIILQAKLKNVSPLMAGKGEGDAIDMEVMTWPDGRPYLPASSLAGCLKHYFLRYNFSDPDNRFWGDMGEDCPQSHIRIDDLVPDIPNANYTSDIALRDGVKINPKTGTAEDSAKYNYQIVEPGLIFPFRAEITIRNGMNVEDAKRVAGQVYAILDSEDFRVGAFTNTGFGKLECSDFKAWYFEFHKDAEAWFEYLTNQSFQVQTLDLKKPSVSGLVNDFSIEAAFQLKTSLIIGAYGVDGDEPDKSQLKSRDKYVLPGKSIRGAIRHRALKILRTLGDQKAEDKINDLFGIVKEDIQKQQKGRLRVEESRLDKVRKMTQDRIRIDRFTGGTISGALFNSQPVWSAGQEGDEMVRITFSILRGSDSQKKKAAPEEKKLLLLLLKDLWLEDLPIGGEKNIGRGVLRGLTAIISNQGEVVAAFERDKTNGLNFTTGTPAILDQLIQTKASKT